MASSFERQVPQAAVGAASSLLPGLSAAWEGSSWSARRRRGTSPARTNELDADARRCSRRRPGARQESLPDTPAFGGRWRVGWSRRPGRERWTRPRSGVGGRRRRSHCSGPCHQGPRTATPTASRCAGSWQAPVADQRTDPEHPPWGDQQLRADPPWCRAPSQRPQELTSPGPPLAWPSSRAPSQPTDGRRPRRRHGPCRGAPRSREGWASVSRSSRSRASLMALSARISRSRTIRP
jgi:hypothetical protein